MKTHNPENERIKRRYLSYLKEAKRYSEASLDSATMALHRFESYTRYKSFKSFHIEQAVAFKRHLAEQRSKRTGDRLSDATVYSTLTALRHFFRWLAGQPGFRSRLSYSDAEYFNPSSQATQIAKAHREQPVPTLEQIEQVLRQMPATTEIERRDRAVIAFAILSGARDGAIASMKLKHVDVESRKVIQDAREVRTKNSKTFTSWFFPIGEGIREIVEDWVRYLTREKLWGPDDPLFPATTVVVGPEQRFQAAGLQRRHWSSATPIRSIFKRAFKQAGLSYFNPHSFRKTLALFGQQRCKTFEELKAWSQNLGHEHLMTTSMSYGEIASVRQMEIMRGLAQPDVQTASATELLEQALTKLKSNSLGA